MITHYHSSSLSSKTFTQYLLSTHDWRILGVENLVKDFFESKTKEFLQNIWYGKFQERHFFAFNFWNLILKLTVASSLIKLTVALFFTLVFSAGKMKWNSFLFSFDLLIYYLIVMKYSHGQIFPFGWFDFGVVFT